MNKLTLSVAGTCVNLSGKFRATVTINLLTGLIASVTPFRPDADIVVHTDCLIYPGFLDLHVHLREDPSGLESNKEDFRTGGQAAANGGVVHVAEMGNNPQPPIDDESYDRKLALTHTSIVPVTLYAMIGPGTNPLQRDVMYKLCRVRTTGSNDTIFFPTKASIAETIPRYRGKHVSQHCEDREIIEACKSELLHEDRRPPRAEEVSIEDALHDIEHVFGSGNICHCSVPTALPKIVDAKKRGVNVTCEVAPHHLYFDRSMITDANRRWMQMNPPLRTRQHRLGMIEALRRGDIDKIATDHAPHLEADKLAGASGQPHLDTLGPFTTWLTDECGFTPQDIVRVCSYSPSRTLNRFLDRSVYGFGYGQINVGYVGSLTVIDTKTPITITKADLKTKCGWSPFEGVTFPGSVKYTIVRGKILKGEVPA